MNGCSCRPSQVKILGLALPRRLGFGKMDYLKVLYSWTRAYRKTFIIEPGLYFTGEKYDKEAPLLVTSNYHMTVFILWRELKGRNARILVIDTDGINVWCSSGKGRFSAGEIKKQIERYDRRILTGSDRVEIILPKLSLSGVSIAELRRNGISPKVGPVLAKDLPNYLDKVPLKNMYADLYRFSMKQRLFTLVPSLAQTIKYSIYIAAGLFGWHLLTGTDIHWQVVPLTALIVTLYVLLFPALPGHRFAVKGLFLSIFLSVGFGADFAFTGIFSSDAASLLFYLFFATGGCLFFALSYTGNSGISNYSLVKKEIKNFLPVTAALFVLAIAAIIVKGVSA
ncbi:MAG: hypothetical protein MUD12_13410 [Spirochaetes bacterium]|jgi:hypothetical protein|nr:hypothetical protein [Spirochaetota bacterium]